MKDWLRLIALACLIGGVAVACGDDGDDDDDDDMMAGDDDDDDMMAGDDDDDDDMGDDDDDDDPPPPVTVKFASFNTSLNRNSQGELITDLATGDDSFATNVAEIIQRVRPDVLLLNEFDYDAGNEAIDNFQENYLGVSQNGADPIEYEYVFNAPSNTGVASGLDLDNTGEVSGGNDAFGFGSFPGQFAMVVLSNFPIDTESARTFQNFLWKDMPGALLPDCVGNAVCGDGNAKTTEDGAWFSEEELDAVRLSSKSHWDVPIQVELEDGTVEVVHFLVSHPTPPVFDGAEDRNGRRNRDEIRFWADYIDPDENDYIYDDDGGRGGLAAGAYFVIAGDQNADPNDGDSTDEAALLLTENTLINNTVIPSSPGGTEQAGLQGMRNEGQTGDPAYDTADFDDRVSSNAPGNLRVDYVLPSANLEIEAAEVFWPEADDPLFPLVGVFDFGLGSPFFPSSDHRLVWVDVAVGPSE